MNKAFSGHSSWKNVDFLRFELGYRYILSLQLKAATWLINTKTLVGTLTIFNINFKNITNA